MASGLISLKGASKQDRCLHNDSKAKIKQYYVRAQGGTAVGKVMVQNEVPASYLVPEYSGKWKLRLQ